MIRGSGIPGKTGNRAGRHQGIVETTIRLQEMRQARGLGAAEIARRVGVSRQTIYAIESGDYVPIRVPLHQTARAGGEYEDFLTGFVLDDGNVWGRPVGVAVAQDGSLLVTDDGSNSIWRISYTGQ
jgi:glucose/arabinose dehydrogenase